MSRKGGIPPELASQVGSFLRTTFRQLDAVKEAAVAAANAGKLQLDVGLLRRRRRAVLADLGQAVLALVEQGALDEADVPELADALAEIRALDTQLEAQVHQAREAGEDLGAAGGDPVPARPPGADPGWRARWKAAGGTGAAAEDAGVAGAADDEDLESFADEADDLPPDWNRRP